MDRLTFYLIVGLFMILNCSAKTPTIAEERANQIKNDAGYYSGEGFGATIEEADKNALATLSESIKMTVSHKESAVESEDNDDFKRSISTKTGISSFTTLTNTEQIILEQEPKAHVLRFMRKADLESALADRELKIQDLISQGLEQEKQVQIGAALQYFNWALSLSLIHPRNVYADVNGKKENVKIWTKAKIATIMNTIKVNVDNVTAIENDFDKYRVNLRFTYLGRDISGLDYSYFNGLKKVDNCHVKNGEAGLEFPELPREEIQLSYEYKYLDVAKKFDEELASFYENNSPCTFSQADQSIPIKVKDGNIEIKKEKKTKEELALEQNDASVAPASVGTEWAQVDKPVLANDEIYANKMKRVEDAIRTAQYTSVKDCFTDDGYQLFMQMMASGKISVASAPQYSVEKSGDFIVGRQIPVSIKYTGNHSCRENIVFRFDPQGNIESMAYALTKVAEEDIFRQSRWSMQARYAILHFMEDYQTAFSLKRLDYIKQIFSDNAIIITGKIIGGSASKRNGFFKASESSYSLNSPKISYHRFDKDEYIKYLEQDFLKKRYVQLRYEENEIAQANTRNLTGDVYWIELKQFYSSDIYCDQGYLTLMLDMTEKTPQIKIRTWTPRKVSLDDMMSRFAVE